MPVVFQFFPYIEKRVYGKSATSASGINHVLARFRVHHIHAHINHISRGEVLPFFTLRCFIDEIFKRFVYDLEIGIEKFYRLQESDTNLKVVFVGNTEWLPGFKNTRPFFLGFRKKLADDFLFQSAPCRPRFPFHRKVS